MIRRAVGMLTAAALAASCGGRTPLFVGDGGTGAVDASLSDVELPGDAAPDGDASADGEGGAGPAGDGSCVEAGPPSCCPGGAGRTNCGAGGSGSESCCAGLPVPGGTFDRTYITDGTTVTERTDPATVSGFVLDKYLVTVGRFRNFVEASARGWTPSPGSGKHAHLNGGLGLSSPDAGAGNEPGWDPSWTWQLPTSVDGWSANLTCGAYATWTDVPDANESRPVNCVAWQEAYAFCIWDGGFLPSQAEWEFAAAGGDELRDYPWGAADPGMTSDYAIYLCLFPNGPGAGCTGVENIAPVGTPSLGAGRWGHLDLVGNMHEWQLDWDEAYVVPCVDCVELTPAMGRADRGGDFGDYNADFLHPPAPTDPEPSRSNAYGLRCARAP